MQYGIIEEIGKLFCKNCQTLVSNDTNLSVNYCHKCGNPLSIDAINDCEKQNLVNEKNVLIKVRDTAKSLNTDSVAKTLSCILEEYK